MSPHPQNLPNKDISLKCPAMSVDTMHYNPLILLGSKGKVNILVNLVKLALDILENSLNFTSLVIITM